MGTKNDRVIAAQYAQMNPASSAFSSVEQYANICFLLLSSIGRGVMVEYGGDML